jgi:4-amino-4-deoxy-L-arabinose transferase-like glycosyltransferase
MKTKHSVLIENVFLTLFAGFFLFGDIRHYLFLPYTDNEGAFVLLGREMGRGARLYSDIWDHKPPLLFVQSWLAQLVFPLTEFRLHLYAFFIHAFNAFLIFQVAKRLEFSRWGAWASVLAYALLLFPPLFQTWTVEADLLIQPFLLLSFWAAFSKKSWIIYLSGALWAAAFFTKQSALFLLPVYLMAGVFEDVFKISKWCLGVILATAALLIPFVSRWDDFYSALIGFNQHYIEKGWLFFFATPAFRDFLVQWAIVAGRTYGFLFLFAVLGSFGRFSKRLHPRTFFFLSVWLLGVLASCCVSGYFFTYYFIALLPPLALGMGLAWMKLTQTRRPDLAVCFLLIAAGALALAANTDGLQDKVFAYAQYPWPRYFADKAVGMAIAGEAKPEDKLLAWSDDPQIYVYAGLSPSIKTPFINHLDGRPADALKTLSDFGRQPPRYCVVSRMDQVLRPPPWFETQLRERYTKVKSAGNLDLYRLLDKSILK